MPYYPVMFASPEQTAILRLVKWLQNDQIAPTLSEIRDRLGLTNAQTIVVVSKLAQRGYLMPL